MDSDFRETIQSLNGLTKSSIDQVVADTIWDLIQKGFESKIDPWGRPWAPDKNPLASDTLDKTGRLRAGFSVSVEDNWIVIINSVDYAVFIQSGTYKMPARKMVPDNGEELPPLWAAAIEAALMDKFGDLR